MCSVYKQLLLFNSTTVLLNPCVIVSISQDSRNLISIITVIIYRPLYLLHLLCLPDILPYTAERDLPCTALFIILFIQAVLTWKKNLKTFCTIIMSKVPPLMGLRVLELPQVQRTEGWLWIITGDFYSCHSRKGMFSQTFSCLLSIYSQPLKVTHWPLYFLVALGPW